MILLHGFPECWYSWRHQMPVLGERFHVIAPDLRGYNQSDKPARVEDYRIPTLIDDVLGLIKFFGKGQAHIVGHDWGAGVAWGVAQRHPEAVKKLATLQVPPPAAWQANVTLRQLRRSWYMFFFQLPRVPERWMEANDFARVRKMFRVTPNRADVFTDADIEVYVNALRRGTTGPINYYRANVLKRLFRAGREKSGGKIQVPTLFIYGEQDFAIIPSTVRGIDRFISAPYREVRIPGSSHWVQNEAVDEVNT